MIVKSCPFCGGRPYIEESQRGFVGGKSTHVCYVRCRNCNARSQRLNIEDFGHTSRSAEAIEKVVAAWNVRVYSSGVDTLHNITTSGDKQLLRMQLKETKDESDRLQENTQE